MYTTHPPIIVGNELKKTRQLGKLYQFFFSIPPIDPLSPTSTPQSPPRCSPSLSPPHYSPSLPHTYLHRIYTSRDREGALGWRRMMRAGCRCSGWPIQKGIKGFLLPRLGSGVSFFLTRSSMLFKSHADGGGGRFVSRKAGEGVYAGPSSSPCSARFSHTSGSTCCKVASTSLLLERWECKLHLYIFERGFEYKYIYIYVYDILRQYPHRSFVLPSLLLGRFFHILLRLQ